MQRVIVEPTDRLFVPHRKRLSHGYAVTDDGVRELRLYYGVKEVAFDDERLFAFGEQLVGHGSFIAEAATAWGPGYAWAELQPLLEALVGEGIIKRGEPIDDPRGGGLVASQLPPSSCPVARAWSAADCEAITGELAGRAVEIGYLEAILSVYRIAHPALDADDRQIGEANVFPPGLRLDRETEWRACQYAGSRYRDDAPMNVTALRAMIKHWKPMLAMLLAVRGELRRRIARSRARWTVGDLHLFSGVVLALPGYQLMLGGAGAHGPQQPVHPVLSSLFRITDGIRMTTHMMLFLSDERTRSPDEPTSASELYDIAERNGLFLSHHGVCAGPRPMIDELLAAVFSDEPAAELAERYPASEVPELRALIERLPEAVDYALLGLMSWSVSRSVWLAMSRAYGALRVLVAGPAASDEWLAGLRAGLDAGWAALDQAKIADDHERDVHLVVYRDTYEQAWRGLRSPVGPPMLAACIAARPAGPAHAELANRLRAMLATRLAEPALAGRLAEVLVGYLREEQAILGATEALQAAINARLDRPRPRRPLTARDLRVVFAMYGGSIAEFPYLFDMLDSELGIAVECTASGIAVVDRRANGS